MHAFNDFMNVFVNFMHTFIDFMHDFQPVLLNLHQKCIIRQKMAI